MPLCEYDREIVNAPSHLYTSIKTKMHIKRKSRDITSIVVSSCTVGGSPSHNYASHPKIFQGLHSEARVEAPEIN